MTLSTLPAQFEGQSLDIIVLGNDRYARGPQIGAALGFANPQKQIRTLYSRNAHEFGVEDTLVVELPTAGGAQLTRLYSERGCIKLAMLASTPKAAAFRDWAAKVLTAPKQEPLAFAVAATALPSQRTQALPEDAKRVLARHYQLSDFVRYAKMGLKGPELSRLLGVKKTGIRSRRRLAESLGLLEPSPHLEKQRQIARTNGLRGLVQ